MLEPRAVLVLYEPGCKLKNNKFLLSNGINIVGNDAKCQVQINSKNYFSQDYVANFYITDDFMYIEALCDNMVQFKSNMQIQSSGRKKDVYKYIDKNCRYILPMEQIFYIGPYKAIVQVQAPHQLKLIKNILNLKNFQTPREQNQFEQKYRLQFKSQNKIVNQQNDLSDAKSDRTQKIQSQHDYQFQPTLVIQQNNPYAYQPTIALDEQQNYYSSKKQYSNNNSLSIKTPARYSNRSPALSPLRSPIPSNSQDSYTKSLIKRQKPSSQLSDIQLLSRQKQKKSQAFSQQALYQTIKKQQIKNQQSSKNKQPQQQDDVSMPDTVQDNSQKQLTQKVDQIQIDMPDTIQQDDYMPPTILSNSDQKPKRIQQDDDQMPPTIQDDAPILQNNPKVAKTMYQKKDPSKQNKIGKNLYKSQKIPKPDDDFQQIDDIFNLFSKSDIKKVDSNQIQIEEKKQVKKKPLFNYEVSTFRNQKVLPHVNVEQFNSVNNLMIKSNNSNANGDKTQKSNPSNPLNLNTQKKSISPNGQQNTNNNHVIGRKRLFKQSQKLKLANVTGFKPKPQDKIILRKRGYQIVPNATIQEYDILIIGKNQQATQKLLMAILLDKLVVTQNWLKQKDWQQKKDLKIQGTIQGINWQIINKQRGRTNIFESLGVFYISDSIESYFRVFETAGGTITKQLNKRKKTNIIINCEVDKDRQFYSSNKNCKNWKFYSHKLISQSILIGEPPLKKYLVDQTSF